VQLPDDTTFWFDGELWAEIVPALPTIAQPAEGFIFHGKRNGTPVAFAWTNDLTANGTSPVAGQPPLPTSKGAEVTIWRCNARSTGVFDGKACTIKSYGPAVTNKLSLTRSLASDYWYRFDIRPAFTLPGDATTIVVGSQVLSRTFVTAYP
jgi:hypothetical protein